MTGIAFSRRNRRSKLYQEVIRSLRDDVAVPHLSEPPIGATMMAIASAVFECWDKADRRRQANADYRQHGAP